jgi:hypothetical protein
MLGSLRGGAGDRNPRASDRKLRLFACASWQRLSRLWDNELCRPEVEQVQAYADHQCSSLRLWDAEDAIRRIPDNLSRLGGNRHDRYLANIALACVKEDAYWAAHAVLRSAPWGMEEPEKQGVVMMRRLWDSIWDAGAGFVCGGVIHRSEAALLRHIIGNPFDRCLILTHWPLTVVQLAQSLHNGSDCAFALHDALLESGHTELAEHFRQEQWHPKGCWAVDLILGKS